jgi:hypothetical protein
MARTEACVNDSVAVWPNQSNGLMIHWDAEDRDTPVEKLMRSWPSLGQALARIMASGNDWVPSMANPGYYWLDFGREGRR